MTKDELVEHVKRLAIGLAVIGAIIPMGLGAGYLMMHYPTAILAALLILIAYLLGHMWRIKP